MHQRIESFLQILNCPVWDGDLISKSDRDELVRHGYVKRAHGFNFISEEGIGVALALGLLLPDGGRHYPDTLTGFPR